MHLARLRSYPQSGEPDQCCCDWLPLPGNDCRFVAGPECISITTTKATTITHPITMIQNRLLRFGPELSDDSGGSDAMRVWMRNPIRPASYLAVISSITCSSDSRQSIIGHPNTRSSLAQFSREFAGLRAGVGYSAVEMGSTRASFAPGSRRCNASTAAEANPNQVVSPAPPA